MTNKIVRNLEILKAAVEAQPEKLFDLRAFKREASCGTLFCTAGLAATMPEFIEQGLELAALGDGWWAVEVDGVGIDESAKSHTIFGSNSFANLFDARDCGAMDDSHPDSYTDGLYGTTIHSSVTDKQLAIWRLEQQIAAELAN